MTPRGSGLLSDPFREQTTRYRGFSDRLYREVVLTSAPPNHSCFSNTLMENYLPPRSLMVSISNEVSDWISVISALRDSLRN